MKKKANTSAIFSHICVWNTLSKCGGRKNRNAGIRKLAIIGHQEHSQVRVYVNGCIRATELNMKKRVKSKPLSSTLSSHEFASNVSQHFPYVRWNHCWLDRHSRAQYVWCCVQSLGRDTLCTELQWERRVSVLSFRRSLLRCLCSNLQLGVHCDNIFFCISSEFAS